MIELLLPLALLVFGVYHGVMQVLCRAGFVVATPSLLTAFTLAASLEYAARRRGGRGLVGFWAALPHFDAERWLFPYLFMGLVIFILGGLTGRKVSFPRLAALVPAGLVIVVAGAAVLLPRASSRGGRGSTSPSA